jgi:hypothetical protein
MTYPRNDRRGAVDPLAGDVETEDATVVEPVGAHRAAESRAAESRAAEERRAEPYPVPVARVAPRRPGTVLASMPSAFALVAGVWLVVSRLVWDFPASGVDNRAYWNGIVIGIAVGLVAMFRMGSADSNPMLSLVNAVFGGWMIASLWVYGYARWTSGSQPSWSDLIAGIVIAVAGLASWSAGLAAAARAATTPVAPVA